MPNSYHQIYIHAVFAVRYQEALLEKAWREKAIIKKKFFATNLERWLANLACLLSKLIFFKPRFKDGFDFTQS